MRRAFIVSTGLFLAALLLPHVLHAAGNVLLPRDDSGSSSSLPNLGIFVAPKTQAPVAEPAKKAEAPVTVPAPAPVSTLPAKNKPVPLTPPIPSFEPVRIIPQTEPPLQNINDYPFSLSISVSNKSSFGVKDAKKISDTLGLTDEQISASCLLSPRGLLKSNKGIYSIPGRLSRQTAAYYDGSITSVSMTAQAMCLVNGSLPKNGGFLSKMGDRFIVPLQDIVCEAPEGGRASSLSLVYDGSGASQCLYQ